MAAHYKGRPRRSRVYAYADRQHTHTVPDNAQTICVCVCVCVCVFVTNNRHAEVMLYLSAFAALESLALVYWSGET